MGVGRQKPRVSMLHFLKIHPSLYIYMIFTFIYLNLNEFKKSVTV
jgi:hypothetical protein